MWTASHNSAPALVLLFLLGVFRSGFAHFTVRYDIANVFNPAYCVAARLEKTELTRAMSFRNRG